MAVHYNDTRVMYIAGMNSVKAELSAEERDASINTGAEMLAIASNDDEHSTLTFWFEEGLRNYVQNMLAYDMIMGKLKLRARELNV